MRMVWLGLGIAALAGCSPKDSCGGEVCTAEQRCSPTAVCITDLPPVLTVDAPLEAMLIRTHRVEVKGTASDDTGGLAVEVSANGGAWIRVTLGTDGAFSTEVSLPDSDATTSAISVRAIDAKGREVKVGRTVKVDNLPPVCAVTGPAEAAVITSTRTGVTLSATDGSLLLVNPRVSTDGALTFSTAQGDGGSYTFEWDLGSGNGDSRELVFRVEDGAGHPCEAKRTVTVDNVKPTVGFASPDAGGLLGPAFFAAGGVLSGPASDGTRMLKSVTLSFADAGVRAATVQAGQWTISISAPAGDDFQPETATVVATDLADHTATATLGVTVDVVAPVLAITAPAANAKLNAATFAAGDNVALAWTLTDGDPQRSIGLALPDGGVQSPPVVATSATDNPKTYQPTLVATDRAGNSSTASVAFTVDRVAPTLTAVPANNTRMFAGFASADFSESMIGGAGMTLVPAATGAWTTSQQWTTSALAKDTVYTASTGSVTDLHGNPVGASSFKFHTATWVPTPGQVLATGVGAIYEAVTDPEGALNLIVYSGGMEQWLQFDSSTGAPQVLASVTPPTGLSKLAAWRTVAADLSSRRVVGVASVTPSAPTSNLVMRKLGSGSVQSGAADAFIPTPAFAAEGTGLGEYGLIAGGQYLRSGRPNVALGFSEIHRIRFNDLRWEVIRDLSTGGSEAQTFGCYQLVGGSWECRTTPVTSIGQTGYLTNAASQRCSVYHDSIADTVTVKWQPTCGPFGNTPPCVADGSINGAGAEVVADPANDGTFYSYTGSGAGPLQLQKLVLDSSCAGSWVAFKLPITLPNAGLPRLLVIRGVPGLLYTENGNLKFLTP